MSDKANWSIALAIAENLLMKGGTSNRLRSDDNLLSYNRANLRKACLEFISPALALRYAAGLAEGRRKMREEAADCAWQYGSGDLIRDKILALADTKDTA